MLPEPMPGRLTILSVYTNSCSWSRRSYLRRKLTIEQQKMATFVMSMPGLTTLCYCGARAGEHTQGARASQSSHQKPALESFLERKRSKRAKVVMAIRNASTPIGAAASLTSAMIAARSRIYGIFDSSTKVNDKEVGRRAVATTEERIGKG